MFRRLANFLALPPVPAQWNRVFSFHPDQLSDLMIRLWESRGAVPFGAALTNSPRGKTPDPRDQLRIPVPGVANRFISPLNWFIAGNAGAIPQDQDGDDVPGAARIAPPGAGQTVAVANIYPAGSYRWRHMIYAYMIENTGIYEIFRKVLFDYSHGERLGFPNAAGSPDWLSATEKLFYSNDPSNWATSIHSNIRPDIRASRRNSYYRMFGMDLNHGKENNQDYPYTKPEASNRDFAPTLEELLREVWVGIENQNNSAGPRPTNDTAIRNSCQRLSDHLRARRRGGNLSREEFIFTSTMSWLHLTVEYDSPIVVDLQADGQSPHERLRKISEKVGVPMHPKAENYFEMADRLSNLLLQVEGQIYNNPANVPTLYGAGPVSQDLNEIIYHWSEATERDLKAKRVAPQSPAQARSNGNGAVPAASPA